MGSHLLIAGFFGCGNLGDDAILAGFVESIKNDDVELTLLSGTPDDTFKNYGVPSVFRRDMRRLGEAIQKCDMLVFAGGSVFQDVTSARSAAYYAMLATRAKKAGKKVVFLGQGVGPLNTYFGKRLTAGAFNTAEAIVVRDPASANLLKQIGVKRPVRMGADLAFLMPPTRETSGDFQVGGMKAIGIAPRPYGNRKTLTRLFADLARMLFQANLMPVLIEMDLVDDAPLIFDIGKAQGGKIPDIRKLETPIPLQERMSRMDSVIAMRLHAGILATNVGVPPFMISYDPKVTAFAKILGMHNAPDVLGLTADRLYELFMSFYRERERNLKIVERKRQELVQMAQVNMEVLRNLIKQPAKV